MSDLEINRREFLLSAAALPIAAKPPQFLIANANDFVPKPLSLWYRAPAEEWVQALPVGNGRIGAMVFGGHSLERLALNTDTFFAGGPYNPINPEAKSALPEVRRLILEGKYLEAQNYANAHVMSKPLKQMSYQPIGDLLLNTFGLENVSEYTRELDLETAIVQTRFISEESLSTREVFASAPDQLLVTRIANSGPRRIHMAVSLTTPQSATLHHEGDDVLVLSGVGPAENGVDG